MNVKNITFDQKWQEMISPEKESYHRFHVLSNNLAAIATAVTFIGLSIISVITLQKFASLIILGSVFLVTPGVELARFFANKARDSRDLAEQSHKVRGIYEKLVKQKAFYPEVKALHIHWKEKSLEMQKKYEHLLQKTLEKETKLSRSPSLIKKYRIEVLEAEKIAKKSMLYTLFLESLIGKQKDFEECFLTYGENLPEALPHLGSWDARDTEIRATDAKFAKKDIFFSFSNADIDPIGYEEVYQSNKHKEIEAKFQRALLHRPLLQMSS